MPDGIHKSDSKNLYSIQLLVVVNDLAEVFGQSCAADQAAVDIRLCEDLGSGGTLNRAAVLDADLLSSVGVIDLSNELADRMADFLCLCGGSDLAL